jgi:hypothetical protein
MREFNLRKRDPREARTVALRATKLRLFSLCASVALSLSCSTASTPVDSQQQSPSGGLPKEEIHALTFSPDGGTLFYAVGSRQCRLQALNVASGTDGTLRELDFCPERLTAFEDGSLLATSGSSSLWLASDASDLMEGRAILAAHDPSHLLERTADGLVWILGDRRVKLDVDDLRAARISGDLLLAIQRTEDGEQLVRFDGARPTPITGPFEAIDSWDVAPRGEEVVFSAKVDSGFDIGIVGTGGGEIRWVAPERADERNVTWAPRGNKITYTFESLDATLVRSVHVPTSFQVIFDLPLTSVRQVSWEPRAERFAVVVESPTDGPRIDWVGYQGEDRENLVAAGDRIDVPVEALFWEDGSGILLGPEVIRYGESRGTVVWVESGDLFRWRAEVARLRREGLLVVMTTTARTGQLQNALDELSWFTSDRCYVVDVSGAAGSVVQLPGVVGLTTAEVAPDGFERLPSDPYRSRRIAAERILDEEGRRR